MNLKEPFDPNNFVERISANIDGGGTKGGQEGFDPVKLKNHFLETIKSLQQLSEQTDAQIVKLEHVCKDQEQKHKENTLEVEKQYKVRDDVLSHRPTPTRHCIVLQNLHLCYTRQRHHKKVIINYQSLSKEYLLVGMT